MNVAVLDGLGKSDTSVDGTERYALGIRMVNGVVLRSVGEKGVVIVSTAGQSDGREFFYPWEK